MPSPPTNPLITKFGKVGEDFTHSILKKYGLDPHLAQTPWRAGTYSAVFKVMDTLTHERALLRLTNMVAYTRDEADALVRLSAEVFDRAEELMPRRLFSTQYTLPLPAGKTKRGAAAAAAAEPGFVMESIIEYIDAVPVVEWFKYFDTPNDLLVAVLRAGQELFHRKVVQRDVSENNILLSRDGRFVFIDNDDACIYPDGYTCDLNVYGTPGYTLAELGGLSLNLNVAASKPTMKESSGISSAEFNDMLVKHTVPTLRKYYRGNRSLQLLHNMVHGLIFVALAAVTGTHFGANFVHVFSKNRNILPITWQIFLLAHVDSLDPSKRMSFDSALAYINDTTQFGAKATWTKTKEGLTVIRRSTTVKVPLRGD